MHFLELTYKRDATLPVSCFLLFLCFRKATQEIFSELDKTKTETPIFPRRRTRTERELEGGQRVGSPGGGMPPSWPRQGVVRPSWWPSDAASPPIKSLQMKNPRKISVFPRTVSQRRLCRRQILGDKSLCFGNPDETGKCPRSHLHRHRRLLRRLHRLHRHLHQR
jgi:hypothetical protein